MTMEKVMEKTMEIQDKKQGKSKKTKQLAVDWGSDIGCHLGRTGHRSAEWDDELRGNSLYPIVPTFGGTNHRLGSNNHLVFAGQPG